MRETLAVCITLVVALLVIAGCTVKNNEQNQTTTRKAIEVCATKGGVPKIEDGPPMDGKQYRECLINEAVR